MKTPFLAILLCCLSAQAEEPRKPNILFILTDDQSPFDFKFHNPESTLDSPNIDRLASGGMIFDAALLLAEMRRLNDPWRFSDQPDDGLAPPPPARKGKTNKKTK